MRNIATQIYLSYLSTFLWLNWPAYLSNIVFRPILFVILFGFVGRFARSPEAVDQYLLGMAAYSILVILVGGASQSLSRERGFGTLYVPFSSPVNRLALFACRSILHIPNGLMTAALCILFAWLFLGLDLSEVNWLCTVVSLLVIAASSAAFALFLGNLPLLGVDWLALSTGSQGLFIVCTGVVIPTSDLPNVLRAVGQVIPLTRGSVAFLASFRGEDLTSMAAYLIGEVLIGAFYFIVGFLVFRLVEADAKRRGTLEYGI